MLRDIISLSEKWNPLAAYCKRDEDAAHDEADNQNECDGYFGGIDGLHINRL